MKEKQIIYAVLPRLFDNPNSTRQQNGSIEANGCGKLEAFSLKALDAIRKMGFTHIWFIGIIEHATTTGYESYGIGHDFTGIVKGRAGSPYAIKDYYDIDPDLAMDVTHRMREFEALVDRVHQMGMKVIIDFVPNHVARQYKSDAKPPLVVDLGAKDQSIYAFSPSNNFYYLPGQPLTLLFGSEEESHQYSEFPAKVSGNDRFTAMVSRDDWYETVKLNYGVDYLDNHKTFFDPIPNTWERMLEILSFWTDKKVDGFRCDMAEMVPEAFWAWVIPQIKEKREVTFIAEIYNPTRYQGYIEAGFDYLYDKVGMYDAAKAMIRGERSAEDFNAVRSIGDELQEHMLYFMENHDEQRLASDFVVGNGAKAIPAIVLTSLSGRNPYMVYFGQMLGERGMEAEGFSGQDGRTTIFDYWSLDKMQRWINDGEYDDRALNEEEKWLLHFYQHLLADICHDEVITDGGFYDLAYANLHNRDFDSHRHHAFVRYLGARQLILVATNMADTTAQMRINMPNELFTAMNMEPNRPLKAVNMLDDQSSIATLTPLAPYELTLSAHSVGIIKFILQE